MGCTHSVDEVQPHRAAIRKHRERLAAHASPGECDNSMGRPASLDGRECAEPSAKQCVKRLATKVAEAASHGVNGDPQQFSADVRAEGYAAVIRHDRKRHHVAAWLKSVYAMPCDAQSFDSSASYLPHSDATSTCVTQLPAASAVKRLPTPDGFRAVAPPACGGDILVAPSTDEQGVPGAWPCAESDDEHDVSPAASPLTADIIGFSLA